MKTVKHDVVSKLLGHLLDIHETITEEIVPSKAMRHFRSSHKEALLGMRSMLDHVIENFDDTKGKETDKSSRSRSITISD